MGAHETHGKCPFPALLAKEWRDSWWLLCLTLAAPTICYLIGGIWNRDPILECLNDFEGDLMAHWKSGGVICFDPISLLWLLVQAPVWLLGVAVFAPKTVSGAILRQNECSISKGGIIWSAKVFLPLCTVIVGAVLYAAVSWTNPLDFDKSYLSFDGFSLRLAPIMALAAGLMAFASPALFRILGCPPSVSLAIAVILCTAASFGNTWLLQILELSGHSGSYKLLGGGAFALLAYESLFCLESVLFVIAGGMAFVRLDTSLKVAADSRGSIRNH
jgi:hypothetical protein